jgi:serine/threonine protein kinase
VEPERWRKIEELYHAARAVEPDRRAAFLQQNCADDESLGREVGSLLLHGENAASFLKALEAVQPPEAGQRVSHDEIQEKLDRAGCHYRLHDKLGQGGMGEVYRAEDTRLRRTVALKFITANASERSTRARFLREAQAAAGLDHPNICPVYGFEEADGLPFIVMALIDGTSLARRMRDGITFGAALDWMIGIGEGLKYAHEHGVIHRDIKAGNVLLTNSGTPRITDFGLAIIEDRSRLTAPGSVMGTVQCMAPEQLVGEDADRRTDIWAAGVLFFEMLTGRNPFLRSSPKDTMRAIMNDPIPAPSALEPAVPADLDRIVGKAMSRSRGERYQHIDDFIVDTRTVRRRLTPEQQQLMLRNPCAEDATTLTMVRQSVARTVTGLGWPLGIAAVIVFFILVALLVQMIR